MLVRGVLRLDDEVVTVEEAEDLTPLLLVLCRDEEGVEVVGRPPLSNRLSYALGMEPGGMGNGFSPLRPMGVYRRPGLGKKNGN